MAIGKDDFLHLKEGEGIIDGRGRRWMLMRWLPEPRPGAVASAIVRLGMRILTYSWVDGHVNGIVDEDGSKDLDWNDNNARVVKAA